MAVRRRHCLHVQVVHPVEGGEELGEWVGRRRQARDVRGDRGQDVVAGQDETGRAVEQAEVVRCAPCVEGHPLAPASSMTSASSRRLVGVGVPTTSRSFAKSIIPSLRRH